LAKSEESAFRQQHRRYCPRNLADNSKEFEEQERTHSTVGLIVHHGNGGRLLGGCAICESTVRYAGIVTVLTVQAILNQNKEGTSDKKQAHYALIIATQLAAEQRFLSGGLDDRMAKLQQDLALKLTKQAYQAPSVYTSTKNLVSHSSS
jgi:hypothetical protein